MQKQQRRSVGAISRLAQRFEFEMRVVNRSRMLRKLFVPKALEIVDAMEYQKS